MSGDGWTIDELAGHAAEALASAGFRAPNGRVSTAPDRRVIRWYATIGLLDPPLRTRGRTARYGERHLLQLVAVKRRQAEGQTLAAIQAELAGATDATLRRVTGPLELASPSPTTGPPPDEPEAAGRREFWRATPQARQPEIRLAGVRPVVTRPPEPQPGLAQPQTGLVQLQSAVDGLDPAGPGQPPGPAAGEPFSRPVRIVDAYDRLLTAGAGTGAGQPVRPVYPVPLHPAATLVLSGQPSQPDLAAIHTAARPLLDLLAARGLLADAGTPEPEQSEQPETPEQLMQPDSPEQPEPPDSPARRSA